MSTSPLSPDDIRAAAEVHRELGPEYSDAVVASFLDKVDREACARVDARLAGARRAAATEPDSRRALLTGLAVGVAVMAVPVLVLLRMQAGRVAQAAASPGVQAGSGRAVQVISRSQNASVWLVVMVVIVLVCSVAAVRLRRQSASRRLARGRG